MGVVADTDVGLEVDGAWMLWDVVMWEVVMMLAVVGSSRVPDESRCCWASCCNYLFIYL